MIASQTEFRGRILWDTTKPNGQPRRLLDTSKADMEFGFKASVNFEEGIRKTIDWYISKRKEGLYD